MSARGSRDAQRRLQFLKAKIASLTGKYGDCRPWMGNISVQGYPRIVSYGHLFYVHRLVRALADSVPYQDMHVHHRCHNRACVRLEHLQPVTPSEHAAIHSSEETTCKRGHPLADAYRRPDNGGRQCRTCIKLRSRWQTEARAREALMRPPVEPKACAICGSVFTPSYRHRKRTTMCSARCRSIKFENKHRELSH